jgi:uncharacterized membrane protein YphA (DoxX/SURF4 family)
MILVRLIVGLVFLLEGALKFIRPEELGEGRFASIGLPVPHLLAPLAGGVEILGGAVILLNLYAGDAALVLLLFILAALAAKLPIGLGRPLGPFPLAANLLHYGWLSFCYEARVELYLLFSLVAILIDSGLRMGHRRRWYQSGL